jgi:hypothetical protein
VSGRRLTHPKLIALAAKVDTAETEFKRVLLDVVEPADLRFFANREDKATPRHEYGGTGFEGSLR